MTRDGTVGRFRRNREKPAASSGHRSRSNDEDSVRGPHQGQQSTRTAPTGRTHDCKRPLRCTPNDLLPGGGHPHMKRRAPELRSSPRKRGPRAADRGLWIPACAGMSGIGRRAFLALLGGAAAAWPLAAHAQQAEQVRRIGVLIANAESDPEGQARVAALRQDLQRLGWTEGRNIRIDYRWGVADPDRAGAYATELVALAPDVIVANGTLASTALQRATRSIPVVFVVVIDPVGAGLVQSLAHPGGNITGFATFEPEIGGKWLELLTEISPGLRRVAGILDPAFLGFATVWREIESIAPRFGLGVTKVVHRDPGDDIEAAVAAFAQDAGGGLIVLPTPANNMSRAR